MIKYGFYFARILDLKGFQEISEIISPKYNLKGLIEFYQQYWPVYKNDDSDINERVKKRIKAVEMKSRLSFEYHKYCSIYSCLSFNHDFTKGAYGSDNSESISMVSFLISGDPLSFCINSIDIEVQNQRFFQVNKGFLELPILFLNKNRQSFFSTANVIEKRGIYQIQSAINNQIQFDLMENGDILKLKARRKSDVFFTDIAFYRFISSFDTYGDSQY